jgi:3-phenylpropionate/trans-cinnamate dioxygenase ferredoxin reductase subunit
VPYENILGKEIGAFYRDVHTAHGVNLLLGDGVESFEGDVGIARVRTTGGRTVECDLAVVGIGVMPRAQLAGDAGLEVGNGIVVDASLRTSDPNVFAAGDVANAWHPFFEQHIRVEHWANALNQGPAAARAMLGDETGYDRIPYFFSDQYDVGMEYSGHAPNWDEVVFRGDREGGEFVAFWLKDSRVIAGMNVNVWDVNEQVQALIRSRREVDRAALASSDVSLEELAGSATTG